MNNYIAEVLTEKLFQLKEEYFNTDLDNANGNVLHNLHTLKEKIKVLENYINHNFFTKTEVEEQIRPF